MQKRKAFEDEADLVRETSKKKSLYAGKRKTVEQLESLTKHLAERERPMIQKNVRI